MSVLFLTYEKQHETAQYEGNFGNLFISIILNPITATTIPET